MERAEKNGRIRALSCPDQSIHRGGYLVWEQYVTSLKVQLIGCGLYPGGNYRFALETRPGGKILFAPARFGSDAQEYSSSFSSPTAACLFLLQGDTPLLYAPLAAKYDVPAAIRRLRDALVKPKKLMVSQEEAPPETDKDAEPQVAAEIEDEETQTAAEIADEVTQTIAEKADEETQTTTEIADEETQTTAEIEDEETQTIAEIVDEETQTAAEVADEKTQTTTELADEETQTTAEIEDEETQATAELTEEPRPEIEASSDEISAPAEEEQNAEVAQIPGVNPEMSAEELRPEHQVPKIPSCFKNWRRYSPPEMLEKYASLSSFITCPDGSRFASVPLNDESLILGELPVEDHIINICAYPAVINPVLKPAETSLTLPLRNGRTCWTSEELIK